MFVLVTTRNPKGSAAPTTSTTSTAAASKKEKESPSDADLEFDLSQATDSEKHGGAGGAASTDVKSTKQSCRTGTARADLAAMVAALQAAQLSSGSAASGSSVAARPPIPRSVSHAVPSVPLPAAASAALAAKSLGHTLEEPSDQSADGDEDWDPREALEALLERVEVIENALLAAGLISEVPDRSAAGDL